MKPLITAKIEPKRKQDLQLLQSALQEITQVDHDASLAVDPESHELILGGVGEMHVDGILNLLQSRKVDFCAGPPQISYLEALYGAAEVNCTDDGNSEGHSELARVRLRVAPNENRSGNTFASEISSSRIVQDCITGIEKGIQSVLHSGPLVGFPMVDIAVSVLEANIDNVNSTASTFETASKAAMREACRKAKVKLLEPIMDVEVVAPDEFGCSVIDDFKSRRGRIQSQENHDRLITITATVPLASMFGYSNQLRSITDDQASFTMRFNCYDEVPRNISFGPDDFPPAIGMRA